MSAELENHLDNGARLLFEMHDPSRAVDEFSRALAIDPHCFVAFIYRHFAYGEMKNWPKALSDLNQAIRLNPADDRLYSYRCDVNIQLHDYSSAYDDVCEALRFLGFIAQDIEAFALPPEGFDDEAVAPPDMVADEFSELPSAPSPMPDEYVPAGPEESSDDEIVEDDDDTVDTFTYLVWKRGYLALKLHRYEQAAEDFSIIVEMQPNDACAWNNRGLAFTRLGVLEEALHDFNKAIELNPDHPDHHNSRANLYTMLGETEKAIADSNVALETCDRVFDPALGDDVVWNDRAEALVRLGRYQEALDTARNSLNIRADDPESNRIMAEAYCGLGKHDDALAHFDRSIESDLDPEVLIKRAELLEKLGQTERAKKDRDLAKKKSHVRTTSSPR